MKNVLAFSALLALVAAAPLPQDSYSSGSAAGGAEAGAEAPGSYSGASGTDASASSPEGAAAPT